MVTIFFLNFGKKSTKKKAPNSDFWAKKFWTFFFAIFCYHFWVTKKSPYQPTKNIFLIVLLIIV
jgi:hypothetical protein